jgi:UDP-2,4-diacetamido-2,4,6-trideoxy-beta-L-altropyranose hydrolase
MRYVTFRVDASTTMGIGHVMRCLTLAEGLRQAGVDALFVCRAHQGNLCQLIAALGFTVVKLPLASIAAVGESDAPKHSDWLGADWRLDAEQTRDAMATFGGKAEWMVSDHYGVDHRWESALRTSVGRIMAIDDLADRRHDCDLLLDQNLVLDLEQRYADRTAASTIRLLGPKFALLQPAYAELHERATPRSGAVRRVLIFFGGGDATNLTGRSIAAFLALKRPDIEADVVITKAMVHAESVQEQIAEHINIHLHTELPTLAHLILQSDLAIGAGGATSWERLCLGLPALVVTLADNQRPLAEGLEQNGYIRWLGHSDQVDVPALTHALAEVAEAGLDEEWSRKCLGAVDGRGMERVRAAMLVNADTPLVARTVRSSDEHLLLAWANDPVTRQNAFTTETISAEAHHRWFQARLSTPDQCRFFIIETEDGTPIGQVRFECADENSWVISYSLAAALRGRGYGRVLLQTALIALSSDRPGASVVGLVKAGNVQSSRIFESLGFSSRVRDEQVIEYRLKLVF